MFSHDLDRFQPQVDGNKSSEKNHPERESNPQRTAREPRRLNTRPPLAFARGKKFSCEIMKPHPKRVLRMHRLTSMPFLRQIEPAPVVVSGASRCTHGAWQQLEALGRYFYVRFSLAHSTTSRSNSGRTYLGSKTTAPAFDLYDCLQEACPRSSPTRRKFWNSTSVFCRTSPAATVR